MSTALDSAANSGVIPVRDELRFDRDALTAWMCANVEGFRGPLTVEQFKGGQSNPTYRLSTPARRYVLRRKPPGAQVKGAHDVLREARVLRALADTEVSVAAVLGVCEHEEPLGAPFYVMDCVEGRIFWDATFPEVASEARPRYFDAMNATMAALHRLDPVAAGLADHGRSGDYFARQISRWSRQYLDDPQAGRDGAMDRLIEWLPRHTPPPGEIRVLHGDFRCDNLIFHPTEPRILAVLDWELSTLGDPVADFAYHALMYRTPPDIVAGLAGAHLGALNIPSEAEYVAAYCARTGREALPSYAFAVTFNLFRLAAIFHGIRGRVLRGSASSAHARERAEVFPRIAAMALASLEAHP